MALMKCLLQARKLIAKQWISKNTPSEKDWMVLIEKNIKMERVKVAIH